MSTVVVQIGNSDNKLTQAEWSSFTTDVSLIFDEPNIKVHFTGYSPSSSPFQNACWVVDGDGIVEHIKHRLVPLVKRYRQDSIALTVGHTEFVEAL